MMEGEEGDISAAIPVGVGPNTGIGFSTVAGALGLPSSLSVARAAAALDVDVASTLNSGGTRGLAAALDAAAKYYSGLRRAIPIDVVELIDEQQPLSDEVQMALRAIEAFELGVRLRFLPPPLQFVPDDENESLHPLIAGPTAFGGGPGTGGPPSDVGLSPTAPTQGDSPNAP
jgi:hypothetical protein